MADLDVQVELRLQDNLSRSARRAMDAVNQALGKVGGNSTAAARAIRQTGDAVTATGRAARAAGDAIDDIANSNGLRAVKSQAYAASRSMERVAQGGRRAGQALQQADNQAGRLNRTLDNAATRMQRLASQAGRIGQGIGRGVSAVGEAGAGVLAAGAAGSIAMAAPVNREQQYLYDATVAFNDRTAEGIRAGVAELRALDQEIVARGGGTLESARAMRGAFMAGGVDFSDVRNLAPLTQKAATAAGAEGADFANSLMAGAKSGQFSYKDAQRIFGMMLTAGSSGSFETRDMAQYLPGIFNATGDMRGIQGTAYHLAGLETIRDSTGDSAEAANRYQNLLSFRNSREAYTNLSKKGINLAHVYRDAAQRGEDMNLAFVGAVQSLVERNKEYQRLKKELPGVTGARADEISNQMGAIQNRIFSEIIGDMQARQGAIALQNGRGRYSEILSDVNQDPESMIDKLFSVMTSSTRENLNKLANEWEKGMDQVLERIKGPLQSAMQWVTGLMAENPEATAAAAGAATIGGMAAAGSGVVAGIRSLKKAQKAVPVAAEASPATAVAAPAQAGATKPAPAKPATTATPTAAVSGAQSHQANAAGRGPEAMRFANGALTLLLAAGSAYATETDDSLTREQKNAAHSQTVGGTMGALAGAKAGAALGSFIGPWGTAIGGILGSLAGGIGGSELGQRVYAAQQQSQETLKALPFDPDDPADYFAAISARAEASGNGPTEQSGGIFQGLDDLLAQLLGRNVEQQPQPSPEDWKAVLLEAAQNMQAAAQSQPVKVELHSTLELDGALLAQSREDVMIREAARR